jgi:two-component system alkaline phosphatase synthesis response regulator PhoP
MYALLLAHNADESAVLRLVLQRAGFASRITTDLETSIQDWQERPSDLILLAFKDQVAIEKIHELRALTEVPIVLVSKPIQEDLHVDLLEAGVDLVVYRPFSARIMISQLRALMRRAMGVSVFNLPNFTVGDLILDPSVRTIQVNDQPSKHLTRLEFRLLYTLMVHRGQVLSTEALVERVWRYSGRGDRDLVRGLVKRLRAKIEPDSTHPIYILTIPGVGYKLQEPGDI